MPIRSLCYSKKGQAPIKTQTQHTDINTEKKQRYDACVYAPSEMETETIWAKNRGSRQTGQDIGPSREGGDCVRVCCVCQVLERCPCGWNWMVRCARCPVPLPPALCWPAVAACAAALRPVWPLQAPHAGTKARAEKGLDKANPRSQVPRTRCARAFARPPYMCLVSPPSFGPLANGRSPPHQRRDPATKLFLSATICIKTNISKAYHALEFKDKHVG
jgi:hypothetical protein